MLVALEAAVRTRESAWTHDREVSTLSAELLHANLLTLLRVNGAKNVGKPLHFTRPWEKPKSNMIRMGEFAKKIAGGSHG